MARRTKADAARQLGISRTTFYKLIDQGKVSPTPDGLIDDAELVRVAPLLDVHRARVHERPRTPRPRDVVDTAPATSEHRERPRDEHTGRPPWTDDARQFTSPSVALVDTLRAQLDTMRHELEAARAERQAAREERALLLQMLQEMQHRYDRLLEAPHSVAPATLSAQPVPSAEAPVFPARDVSPGSASFPNRSAARQRILAMLREHPEGLTAVELRRLLRADRSLTDTCAGMFKDGLLRRVRRGRYVVA